jgi:hypothetical protein
MIRTLATLLLAGTLAACGGTIGSGDFPSCQSTEVCVHVGANVCRPACAADGGGCAAGLTCTMLSGCCTGTGCAAVIAHACCPSTGC